MKECKKCSIEKPLIAFSKDKRQESGYFYYCKECCAAKDKAKYAKNTAEICEKAKTHYAKNRKKVRNQHLQKMYGIDTAIYEGMREQQLFSCLICKEHEDTLKRGLFVDHCHTTGKVRGLLCQPCNFLLGMARDDRSVLKQAIKYLDQHNERTL
tara:strand:+ start:68 stop:529 length:462 start_codon:yes stop_codon:yes gene_type:complete